jgi:hypothetical protein
MIALALRYYSVSPTSIIDTVTDCQPCAVFLKSATTFEEVGGRASCDEEAHFAKGPKSMFTGAKR